MIATFLISTYERIIWLLQRNKEDDGIVHVVLKDVLWGSSKHLQLINPEESSNCEVKHPANYF